MVEQPRSRPRRMAGHLAGHGRNPSTSCSCSASRVDRWWGGRVRGEQRGVLVLPDRLENCHLRARRPRHRRPPPPRRPHRGRRRPGSTTGTSRRRLGDQLGAIPSDRQQDAPQRTRQPHEGPWLEPTDPDLPVRHPGAPGDHQQPGHNGRDQREHPLPAQDLVLGHPEQAPGLGRGQRRLDAAQVLGAGLVDLAHLARLVPNRGLRPGPWPRGGGNRRGHGPVLPHRAGRGHRGGQVESRTGQGRSARKRSASSRSAARSSATAWSTSTSQPSRAGRCRHPGGGVNGFCSRRWALRARPWVRRRARAKARLCASSTPAACLGAGWSSGSRTSVVASGACSSAGGVSPPGKQVPDGGPAAMVRLRRSWSAETECLVGDRSLSWVFSCDALRPDPGKGRGASLLLRRLKVAGLPVRNLVE